MFILPATTEGVQNAQPSQSSANSADWLGCWRERRLDEARRVQKPGLHVAANQAYALYGPETPLGRTDTGLGAQNRSPRAPPSLLAFIHRPRQV